MKIFKMINKSNYLQMDMKIRLNKESSKKQKCSLGDMKKTLNN